MDVNTAVAMAEAAGCFFRWDTNLRLHAVYFDFCGIYFTTKELREMPPIEYEAILMRVYQQEAYQAENYGEPTRH
jgi:hypothetical protein